MGLFSEIIGLMKSAVMVGGGLWLLWGAIVLAGGLKDKNGPQLQSGIWQIAGGAIIIAAGALFSNLEIFK